MRTIWCSVAAGSNPRVFELIPYFIFSVLLWTAAHAGPWLSMFYARLMDRALPKLRRIALRNLEGAFPEKTAAERSALVDGVFRSIGRMIFTFSRLPAIDAENVSQWIRYEGLENYLEAKKQGRGVLVATGHLGNWELSAYSHAILTEPMKIVVRPLDNPRIDALVERYRQHTGNGLIGKWDAPRAIIKALRANEAVGILIDQNTSEQEGVFVDFFGTRACAGTAFARFAARTGAAVIPGFALWSEAEGMYVLRFYPPVSMQGDVQADTQRLHTALETIIRENPDQWLWIHRRWKTRPPGDPPFYG